MEGRAKHGAPLLAWLAVVAQAALRDTLAKDDPTGLIGHDERAALHLRALAILRAYADEVAPRYRPVAVEEAFTVPLDGLEGWTFTGRLDARTDPDGGQPTIVDWKTAGKPWPKGAEHHKDQASAYLWSMPAARRVTFITLPTAADAAGVVTATCDIRTTTRTPEQISNYAGQVRATAREITDALADGTPDAFPARTGPLCSWCSCLSACSSGMAWLRERGREPAVPMMRVKEATA